MRKERTKLVREQLGAKLERLKPLRDTMPPHKGWIRAIRDALGMTGEQLAKRLGVSKKRISRIEHDEVVGDRVLHCRGKSKRDACAGYKLCRG